MNFTNNPFEKMMKEKPRPKAPAERKCCSANYLHLDSSH